MCKQILVKDPNTKFHEKLSSGSRNVSRWKTDKLTVVMKKVAGLANCFANAPKMAAIVSFVGLSNAKQTYINTRKSVLTSHLVRLYKMTQKSVNLQHFDLILMSTQIYPSHFVKLYHSLVGCALNMEDLPSNGPF